MRMALFRIDNHLCVRNYNDLRPSVNPNFPFRNSPITQILAAFVRENHLLGGKIEGSGQGAAATFDCQPCLTNLMPMIESADDFSRRRKRDFHANCCGRNGER